MQGQAARREPIPGALNLALTAIAVPAALLLLRLASHAEPWGWRLAAVVAFSYVNNTIFSLLHEAVHGIFHPRRAVNDACGRVTAAFFPTGFTFQRVCHLGHHRRNRSDVELFDYFLPEDNRPLKAAQWYGILTGVYWLLPPLACLGFLLWPRLYRRPFFRSRAARQTSAEAMLSGFEDAPAGRIRLEILFSILMQATMVWALDLSLAGWLACYAAFALNWSGLQYADHAWSSRDVHDGAWNLRVNRIVRYLFLNYHHHRAHHQHPSVPWLHLPKYVDPAEERPSFLRIYLQMWRGPRPWPAAEAPVKSHGSA
jgi:fatty acid desaturase